MSDELLYYNRNLFDHGEPGVKVSLPMPDEGFAAPWKEYANEAVGNGTFDTLKKALVQFHFPIRKGISSKDWYRTVTLRGTPPATVHKATGLILKHPEGLRLVVNPTAAGNIPILIAEGRSDFELLIRALTEKNEPVVIPPAMGATMVVGYNNWDRINRLKEKHEAENSGIPWDEEFQRIISLKELYQDKFIILSDGPYSGVAASIMGLEKEVWRDFSITIRREHECAHYFTKRLFSSMRNNILDELLADYAGITAACKRFRKDWFLLFLGLEAYPDYRSGGRLENYKGEPQLSDAAFTVLQSLVKRAADAVEEFDSSATVLRTKNERLWFLITLSYMTMEELASDEACAIMERHFNVIREQYCA